MHHNIVVHINVDGISCRAPKGVKMPKTRSNEAHRCRHFCAFTPTPVAPPALASPNRHSQWASAGRADPVAALRVMPPGVESMDTRCSQICASLLILNSWASCSHQVALKPPYLLHEMPDGLCWSMFWMSWANSHSILSQMRSRLGMSYLSAMDTISAASST